MKEQCLKCLMFGIDEKGNKVYDFPDKSGDGPDCMSCLGLDETTHQIGGSLEVQQEEEGNH